VLKLGADTVVASSHVRLLGVDISLDLSVDCHVSRVCAGCFYRLVNSGVSGGRWTLTRWPRSSMLSSTREWITVTPYTGWCTKDNNGQNYSGC